MVNVVGKSLSVSGTYLVKRAKDLARKLLRFNRNSKIEVIDGYLVVAKRSPAGAVGTVIDPPGALMVFDAISDDRGTQYSVGQRDYFDSRVGLTNGPYTYTDITPTNPTNYLLGLGFDPEDTDPLAPWVLSNRWRGSVVSNRDSLHQNLIRFYPPPGSAYPYEDFDQVPDGAVVFSGSYLHPSSAGRRGYWWAENSVASLAPGYQLMCRTNLGYMSYQYQGMQPTTASDGTITLMVIPIVKNFDPDQSVHWGHSAILFVLLNYAANQSDGTPTVVWSQVWSPDSHDITFFHNGPWQAEPDNVSSFFPAPQAAWEQFWLDWGAAGEPHPAGGSQPNWTDAISTCWFDGEYVVNVRCCALNGALTETGLGFDGRYETAGGSALVRFRIPPTGGLDVGQVQYDVWDSPGSVFGITYPYDVWVEGILDEDVLYGVNPVATLVVGTSLVEVTWRMEGDRQNPIYFLGNGPFIPALFDTGRLEFSVTRLDSAGVRLPPATVDVVFDTLGAGVQGPTTIVLGTMVLLPPTSSYKLWPMTPMVVAVSDREVAFVCHAEWGDYANSLTTQVKFGVLDLDTGVAEVRSDMGFIDDPKIGYEYPVHLNCVQETRYDDLGNVTIEGVIFASGRMLPQVRISRDSGRTWQDYLTFPQASGGAYYKGSPLAVGKRPGAAIN